MRNALWVSLAFALTGCNNDSGLNAIGDNNGDVLLTMDTPAAAAFMARGNTTVSGQAIGLTEVTVNGNPAAMDGTSWSTEVALERGVNLVEARGTDELSNSYFLRHGVLAGDFADPVHDVDEAVTLRLNDSGLDEVLTLAVELVEDADLAGTVMGMNPVYETSVGLYGFDLASIEANVTGLYFDRLSIDAEPKQDKLHLDIWIPNFYVSMTAGGEIISWDYSVDASVWASRVELATDVTIDVDGAGHLVVNLSEPTVELVGFGYDTSLIPGDIESWLFIGTVTELLEGLLADMVEERVPGLLQETLSELEIEFETEIMERTLSIDGGFSRAEIDPKGLELALDMGVDMPGTTSHPYAGYLSAEDRSPNVDQSADMAVGLSDDLLNLVLFEAWQSGILKMEMSTDDGSLDPVMLAPLGTDSGTIKIDAAVPPVIVENDNGLQVQLTELSITVETPGGEQGNFINVSASAFIDLELEVRNGVVGLDYGTPELDLIVRDSDWGASNEATTGLLGAMLPVSMITGLLGDIAIPLPEIAGIRINRATVDRDNSGVHTGIEIDID